MFYVHTDISVFEYDARLFDEIVRTHIEDAYQVEKWQSLYGITIAFFSDSDALMFELCGVVEQYKNSIDMKGGIECVYYEEDTIIYQFR